METYRGRGLHAKSGDVKEVSTPLGNALCADFPKNWREVTEEEYANYTEKLPPGVLEAVKRADDKATATLKAGLHKESVKRKADVVGPQGFDEPDPDPGPEEDEEEDDEDAGEEETTASAT